jgi:hypothetical protein
MFSDAVAERLGWYVYALRNPMDGRVFYIGKGKGNRVFQHAVAAEASLGTEEVSQKLELIREIRARGREVEAFILRHGIKDEELAYEVEAAAIDLLELLDPKLSNERFTLTNLVKGHHHATRGLASAEVVASLYDAPPAPEITVPAMLIKIPDLWTPTMSAEALYEATRHWWRVSDRCEQAKYVFSISHGVIREVYAVELWRPWIAEEADKDGVRWGFDGHVAQEMAHYRHTSVAHLYKPGSANPIRYENC